LNAGRLSHYPTDDDEKTGRGRKSNSGGGKGKAAATGKAGRPLAASAALRAKVVRQRKEALKYSVERLELEVLQKERELRMRLEQA
jgi:DASH complex subunit SPC19